MAERLNINQQLEIIKNVLAQAAKKLSIRQIQAAAGLDIPIRTLQRRLQELVDQQLVIAFGHTRSKLYQLANHVPVQPANEVTIPLSRESGKILEQVSRPIQQRIPVGYNAIFLQSYRPNTDSYLSAEHITKLEELGKAVMPGQPAGTYAKAILHRLLIDLSFNSSRLEGNTYSLLDTERLIAYGQEAGGKSATEAQMILNHKAAIEFIVEDAEAIGFNRYTLLNLHALLSDNLLEDPAASGRLRYIPVAIGKSVYTPPGIPQQIEEWFELLLAKTNLIQNPFEQAFFVMVHLPYLQPFDDVNKRVSRLAVNIPFNRENLVPLSFIDVPGELYIKGMLGVYEFNKIDLLRDVFLWAYERSASRYKVVQQSLGEPDPFRLRYRDQIKNLVTTIVTDGITFDKAISAIRVKAGELPQADQSSFAEAVESELLSLHEGNIARYRLRPSVFSQWKNNNKRN